MNSSLRLAGAAVLTLAFFTLGGCAKKTDETTTTTVGSSQAANDAGGSATTAPDASSTGAPDATSTAAADASGSSASTATTGPAADTAVAAKGTNGAGSTAFITFPVYPGAAELKDQALDVKTGDGSMTMRAYTTKDDAKVVADWYKAHLPAAFKGAVLTAAGGTTATYVNEHADGDQSVLIGGQPNQTTRIQLTTKHGK